MKNSLKVTQFGARSSDITRCTNLAIKSIGQEIEGYCEFEVGQTCVAKHIFNADVINVVGLASYQWTTDIGTVINGDTNETFEVWVTGNKDVTITIGLTVTDLVLEASLSAQFISEHIQVQDCIFADTDGTWQGYVLNQYGGIDQGNLVTGEPIHAIKWHTTDDRYRIELGDSGDLQLPDTDIISVDYLGVKRDAVWDGVSGYQINDVTMTDDLRAKYAAGDRIICFGLSYLPNLVIQIDFKELS